jgi:serine/threonine protein kinase
MENQEMTLVAAFTQRAREALAERYAGLTLTHEGRTGLVFGAHRGAPDAPAIAVRVAYPDNGRTAQASTVARFRREAEIGARLSHPHILRNGPVQSLHGIEFYEMDKAGPVRLDQLIIAKNPPLFPRVLVILQQLADALDYAHAHGVVHGALRPSAVLLDASGNVLLKGFCLYAAADTPSSVLSPAAVGDPAYMAPEQWHDAIVNRAVDVYALGVLAYELCTGHARVGYDTRGVPEIRPIELAPNHCLRDDVPMYVTDAIRRAISRDPALRFHSAGQFVEALSHPHDALGHSLPTIKPPRPKSQHSAWMLLGLVLFVGTVLVLTVPSEVRDQLWGWIGRAITP